MKRVVVFAHYDKNGLIQDYVLYYLKELQKFVDKIVFVSDTNLSEKELLKVAPFVVKSIAYRHGEYDFGSYKRGFIYAKENGLLEDCEELIFANDSCYAPVLPFDEMFNKMSPQNLDFWGVTINKEGVHIVDGKHVRNNVEHVQSYFVVFKPQIFNAEVFNNFILSVKNQESKSHVIAKYEVGMTKLLMENGFKYDVYCQLSKTIPAPHVFLYKELIAIDKSPFLKRGIVLLKEIKYIYPIFLISFVKKNTSYNFNLIKKDCLLNKENLGFIQHFNLVIKALRRMVIRVHISEKSVYIWGRKYDFNKNQVMGL